LTRARATRWFLRSRVIYPAIRLLVHGLLRLWCGLRAHGLENIPDSGPLILVANHQSYLDPFLVGAPASLRPHYLVHTTFMRKPLTGALCRAFGGLEVGHAPPARSLRAARLALQSDHVLEIFPEGGRSLDGRVLPFARGFAQLARVTRAEVVPIAIVGAHQVWPPQRALPRPGRVAVHYGKPMAAPGRAGLTGAAARQADGDFAEEVRQAVLNLTGGRLEPGQGALPAPARGDQAAEGTS